MKKIFIFCMLLMLFVLTGCEFNLNEFIDNAVNKAEILDEFLDSNAMDLEIYVDAENNESKIEKKLLDLKFNDDLLQVSFEEIVLTLDFNNDLLFYDDGIKKAYTKLNTNENDTENTENDVKFTDYIENISLNEDVLSFELNINKILQENEIEQEIGNLKCYVGFENDKVTLIKFDLISVLKDVEGIEVGENDKCNVTIKVNEYGNNIQSLKTPIIEDYVEDEELVLYLLSSLMGILGGLTF